VVVAGEERNLLSSTNPHLGRCASLLPPALPKENKLPALTNFGSQTLETEIHADHQSRKHGLSDPGFKSLASKRKISELAS